MHPVPASLSTSRTPSASQFANFDRPGSAQRAVATSQEEDGATFSAEAQQLAKGSATGKKTTEGDPNAPAKSAAEKKDQEGLSEAEKQELTKLKDRDREVRQHELTHVRAAGPHYKAGPFYDFQKGPDGKQYAVGGHVDIDISPVANDPQATVIKAEQVKKAALAPADPSGQDRQVAAKAEAMKAQAQQEIQAETLEDGKKDSEKPGQTAIDSKERDRNTQRIDPSEKERRPDPSSAFTFRGTAQNTETQATPGHSDIVGRFAKTQVQAYGRPAERAPISFELIA